MVKEIKGLVTEWYNSFIKPQFEEVRSYNYWREISFGIVAVVLVGGIFWGYRYFRNQKESAAQVAFVNVMQMYHEAMQGKSDAWPQLQMQSGLMYEKHKGTTIAPFLLMIQSDAMAHQAKLADAISTIDTVIEQLPKDFPVLSMYKTKRALMKMDMPDVAVQTAGLNELRALAEDKENKNNDLAQYYVGLYYWSRNDIENAVNIWKQLVMSQAHEKFAMSPWAALAKDKLDQRGQLPEPKPIEVPTES